MLTALTMSAVRLTDMAGRAKKVVEEKRRRAEFALIASTSEKWNWITDDKEGFIPAKVLKENPDGSMEVEYGVSRSVKVVKKNEQGPPIVRVAEIKNHFDDMVRMGDVNEATILHNLRMRFAEDIIYTNIGSILVS
jgi:myosin heavy subunit